LRVLSSRDRALLKKPVDTDRALPLTLPFPQHRFLRTEVVLPVAWPADAETKTIVDPSFSFRMSEKIRGSKLEMEYEYNSLADSVPAKRVAEYIQHLNEASQTLAVC